MRNLRITVEAIFSVLKEPNMSTFHKRAPLLLALLMGLAGAAAPKFRVIAFYSANWDPAHINFVHETNGFFPKFAADNGFAYDSTTNWGNLNNADFMAKYQVVMFLDNRPSAAQYAGFQRYMENGGGFLGFHVCAFTTSPGDWDWYSNKLLGSGAFKTNTWGPTSAIMKVEDPAHPVTLGFPTTFKSEVSEWYNWRNDLRTNPDIKILCSIDPSSYPLGTDPAQSWTSGYNPIVWANKKYRAIYCNSGHNDMDYSKNPAPARSKTWDNEPHRNLILNALNWLAGRNSSFTAGRAEKTDDPGMRIDLEPSALTVYRAGIPAFGISILDSKGALIAAGGTDNGVCRLGGIRFGKGVYIIRSQSPAGSAVQTLWVP